MTVSLDRCKPAQSSMFLSLPGRISVHHTARAATSVLGRCSGFDTSGHPGSTLDHPVTEPKILPIGQSIRLYRNYQKNHGPLFLLIKAEPFSLPLPRMEQAELYFHGVMSSAPVEQKVKRVRQVAAESCDGEIYLGVAPYGRTTSSNLQGPCGRTLKPVKSIGLVVFSRQRWFTPPQFLRFMSAQLIPYPETGELIAQFKVPGGLKSVEAWSEGE